MFRIIRTAAILAVTLSSTVVPLPARATQAAPPTADEWTTFEGTWLAHGDRQVIPTEYGFATSVHISGAINFTKGTARKMGLAEAIGFDDGKQLAIGRAVWTDDRKDKLFSELKGGPIQTGNSLKGSFTGGTGPYAGITGDYELTWQFVSRGSTGEIQVRAVDLKGRYRKAGRQ